MMRSDEQTCMFIIYVVVCAFVICNLFLDSGLPVSVSVCPFREPKKVLRGTWETPATFGFGAWAAQLPSSPPPPQRRPV